MELVCTLIEICILTEFKVLNLNLFILRSNEQMKRYLKYMKALEKKRDSHCVLVVATQRAIKMSDSNP
jgi:hypothetical protein